MSGDANELTPEGAVLMVRALVAVDATRARERAERWARHLAEASDADANELRAIALDELRRVAAAGTNETSETETT